MPPSAHAVQYNPSQLAEPARVELTMVGLRDKIIELAHVFEGPFLFVGSIPDNSALGAVDLTLAAAMTDPALRLITGAADNPDVIMQVEAVEFVFDGGSETDAIRRAIMENCYLEHRVEQRRRRIPLHTVAGDLFPFSQDTNSGTTRSRRPGATLELTEELLVGFKTDDLELVTLAAVNTVATVPFWIVLHGGAWKVEHGRPDVVQCKTVDDARQMRAYRGANKQLGGTSTQRRRARGA